MSITCASYSLDGKVPRLGCKTLPNQSVNFHLHGTLVPLTTCKSIGIPELDGIPELECPEIYVGKVFFTPRVYKQNKFY